LNIFVKIRIQLKTPRHRIDKNYSKLIDKYGDNCELAIPIINAINILIDTNASNEVIPTCFNNIESQLIIIKKKLQSVKNIL